MINKRKYLVNGYALSVPKCRDTSTTIPFKSTFIDTNRISTIEHSLGDFERVSEEIKKKRAQEKQRQFNGELEQKSQDVSEEKEPEVEEFDENIVPLEEHPTDLQLVRKRRDELQEMINKLKSQIEQAQSLLNECNVVLGEDEKDKKLDD